MLRYVMLCKLPDGFLLILCRIVSWICDDIPCAAFFPVAATMTSGLHPAIAVSVGAVLVVSYLYGGYWISSVNDEGVFDVPAVLAGKYIIYSIIQLNQQKAYWLLHHRQLPAASASQHCALCMAKHTGQKKFCTEYIWYDRSCPTVLHIIT